MDFWISDWISGFHSGFLDFTVDFWISQWISGFQLGFLPTVYEISFVTDPSCPTHNFCLYQYAMTFRPAGLSRDPHGIGHGISGWSRDYPL